MERRKLMKRRHPRYSLTATAKGREITLMGVTKEVKGAVRGRIRNISAGGLCFETAQPLRVSSLVRCEIPLAKVPVAVPTLLQVRWARPDHGEYNYRIGLQFVL
jgi:hypothetical protein